MRIPSHRICTFALVAVAISLWFVRAENAPAAGTRVAQASQPALDQALAAELLLRPGSVVTPLGSPPLCTPSDASGFCISAYSRPDEATRGIAVFGTRSPGLPRGLESADVLGQMADGTWKYWFTNYEYAAPLTNLPGYISVCAGGDGLNVRQNASAASAVITQLEDSTPMKAERFVLTIPGEIATAGISESGDEGWYQISSPVDGWVSSRFVIQKGLPGGCRSYNPGP